MQFRQNGWIRTTVTFAMLLGGAMVLQISQPMAFAQTLISGNIVGTVTDPTGAVVPGAAVTVKNLATASTWKATANTAGQYRVSLLGPGSYQVTVEAPGFKSTGMKIDVSAGSSSEADIKMTLGNASQTVEVSASAVPLLHTDDAQLSTVFTMQQVQTLPNPGNDLTFIAQTSPGAVMNTQSGYGNFDVFGLPATSNTATVNGGYENDPFLNLINSGATNLLLGNNDIATVTVIGNAYNASFGGLGGAQLNEITRSGSNSFHGNAEYWWNGRIMNANDFFNNQTQTPRPFDNVNQWAAAIGGPVYRNKTFFFFNTEGLRLFLPSRATVYAPDASYISNTLANLAANGLSSEIPAYNNIFSYYISSPAYATAPVSTSDTAAVGPPVLNPSGSSGCITTSGGVLEVISTAPTPIPTGAQACSQETGYGTKTFNETATNFTKEWLITARIDQEFSDKDRLFGHTRIDKGLQATYTNVLNPIYNADSPQPQYDGQLGETHIFTPNLTNQFLFSAIYYRAIFTNTNLAAAVKQVPFSLIFADQDLSSNPSTAWPGGVDMVWPQGRNVTGYQFQDDVSWTKGKHNISFGWTMRRDDVTDYSPSEYTASPEAYTTNNSFEEGYVDYWFQQFPTRSTQPVALYAMGWYLQDQWKVQPNLTVTAGLRMEHDSNVICVTNCFSRLTSNFSSASTNPNTPYYNSTNVGSGLILPYQHQGMKHLQTLGYEPRLGFAWLPDPHTTVRGGFGMFADDFPGLIADSFLNNPPGNVPFTIYGPAFGGGNNTLAPSAPNSAASIAAASDAGFKTGFSSNGSFATIATAVPTFSAPNITNPRQSISYPIYEEWSLAVERQLDASTAVTLEYVGNRSYHQPELNNGVNAFNGGGAAGFPELSTTGAPNPSFGGVTEVSSSAVSNYNGLVASAIRRSKTLTLQLNYTYSHALDEISNGGFVGFSSNSVNPDNPFNLASNYGNADYDTRNYISASYVYSVPYWRGPHVLTDGWEFSGTVFHNSGFPFSVVDTGVASAISNYGGPLFGKQITPLSETHCGGAANSYVNGHACKFTTDYTHPTDFGQSHRNQIYGPSYTDTDFAALKSFNMPRWQSGKLIVGAQFYNLFNHPNFAQPQNNLANSQFGTINAMVNTPTSILGSFLGGDASPRLIQIKGEFVF